MMKTQIRWIGWQCLAVMILMAAAVSGWAQGGSRGTVSVSVTDTTGSMISEAKLTLVDLKTGDTRNAVTLEKGTFTFTGLLSGTYSLTVEKVGFQTQHFDKLLVEAARTTDVLAKLQVGAATASVEVSSEYAPLIEATSSAIGMNLDTKQIEDLPMLDRDISSLANYVAGASDGVFNGMRAASQTNTIDGVMASSSRMKDNGNDVPAATPRIENIDEMVVQTEQLDLNQGFGQANMQVGFTTRRGGEKYHGRFFLDLQNDAFNAPGWMTDYYAAQAHTDPERARAKYHKNEFGASVGGPVAIAHLKDKLFFFASYSQDSIPGQGSNSNNFPNASLQSGIYTYQDTNGNKQSVNLFSMAQSLGLNLPAQVNKKIANEFANISGAAKLSGLLGTDPNDGLNIEDLNNFHAPANQTWYYPTVRLDYNFSQNLRVNLAYNETKYSAPTGGMPLYPGPTYDATKTNNQNSNYTVSLGVDWMVKPTLLNQFRGGYLYTYAGGTPVAPGHLMDDVVWWNTPELNWYSSGDIHAGRVTHFYPLGSLSDNLVWQHGSHNLTVGGSWYREQDHYWDNPQGYQNVAINDNVGSNPVAGGQSLQPGDPALAAFTNATMPKSTGTQQLIAAGFYGLLTGRIGGIGITKAYSPSQKQFVSGTAVNLDELQQGFGLFAQDSWKVTSHLTLNYGLRWDFTGDDHDLASDYHTILKQDLWGPTGYMNQFNPGSFKNTNTNPSFMARGHAYSPWNVSPQPAIGLAWSPSSSEGGFGKLFGEGKTVIRAGYALRNYTEAYQNFWDYASSYGSFYYQGIGTNATQAVNGKQAAGTFAPGAYSWGDTIPAADYVTNPVTYQTTVSEASQTFLGQPFAGFDQNIKQPYIQSWNLGIQRELNKNNTIEMRYVGNHALHEWLPLNINEVNIFESGFLGEFKTAQANLKASGGSSFGSANSAKTMPLMTAAFGGDPTQWSNGSFIYNLQNGQVGTFASALTQASYFCNLASNMQAACANNANIAGGGAGPYPSNQLQANPYASGQSVGYLTSMGSSNYHSVQLEFREKDYHGANFSVNYTFSKALGIRPLKGNDSNNYSGVTMRNLRLSRSPADSDQRQVLNVLGTYDLPIGKGKALAINNKFANAVIGDWTWGTITTFHTGLPFLLTGGNMTYNDFADGGISLTNVTLQQLRKAVGIHRVKGANYANFIDPKYLSSAYLSPNTTPGVLGERPWLWAPHQFNTDMSLSKAVNIREGVKFSLQGEFLNATNHPTWGVNAALTPSQTQVNAMGAGFGQTSPGGARKVEVRANLEF
jgi:hypothetical protein